MSLPKKFLLQSSTLNQGGKMVTVRMYVVCRFNMGVGDDELSRDETAEPISRDQILRRGPRREYYVSLFSWPLSTAGLATIFG